MKSLIHNNSKSFSVACQLKWTVSFMMLVCLGFLQSPILAQELSGYQTNGSAINYGDGLIRMTGAGEAWVSSTAWNTTQHSLNDTFELSVNMFFGCDNGPDGADGIAFQMHNDPNGTSAIGAGGGGMGMVGTSIGVEFDTWNYAGGGDIADDHLTIIQDGNPNSIGPDSLPYLAGPVAIDAGRDLEDCAQNSNDYYTVTYRYIPGAATQTFEVYEEHATTPSLSYTGDIINDIFDGDTLVWWGFTSSTGGGDNEQWIAPEGAIIPWECSVNTCCAPFDVSTNGPLTICQGDTLDINVVGTYQQYYWSTGDTTQVAQITEPGWYTVDVIQNQAGSFCPGSDSIEVVATGVLGTFSGDAVICDDGVSTTPLTIEFTGGTGPYELTYTIDGVEQAPISPIASSPFTFNSSTGAAEYSIVTLEDATGCAGFVDGDVTVSVYPGTVIGLDSSICAGSEALLAVVDEGGTYDWYIDQMGGVSFHTGTDFQTGMLLSDTTYWVENIVVIDSIETSTSYADSTAGTGNATRSEGYNPSFDINNLYFTANRDMILDSVDAYVRQYAGSCAAIEIQIIDVTDGTTDLITYNPVCQGLGINIYPVPINYQLENGHDYIIGFNSTGPHVPLFYNNIVPSYPINDYEPITFTSSDRGANAMPALFNFQVTYPYEGASCDRTPVTAYVIEGPVITSLVDTMSCDEFELPEIVGTNLTGGEAYYSGLYGTGAMYAEGDVLNADQTVYIYDSLTTVGCADQDTFELDIVASPEITSLADTSVCDSLVLPAIAGNNLTGGEAYYSGLYGTGTSFASGAVISVSSTVYVYDSLTTNPYCADQDTFEVTVALSPEITSLVDTMSCDEFELPEIVGTNLTGGEAYYSGLYGTGAMYAEGDVLNADQTVYIYDSLTTVGCADQDTFELDIVASPEITSLADTSVCDSLVLPAIAGNNLTGGEAYYSGLYGTGISFASGAVISVSSTVYVYDSLTTNPYCADQDTFEVTVALSPEITSLVDTMSCDEFELPEIVGTNLTGGEAYYSGLYGTGTMYSEGDVLNADQTVYIYDSLTTVGCADQDTFELDIVASPEITSLADTSACDSLVLPAIAGNNLTGGEAYYSGLYGTGTSFAVGETIFASSIVYVYDSLTTNPYCVDQDTIEVTVNLAPELDEISDVASCDDLTLPSITGANLSGGQMFYSGMRGSGTSYSTGDIISSTMTIYVYDSVATLAGCYDEVSFDYSFAATPDPVAVPINPSACDVSDGEIELSNLSANELYTIIIDDSSVSATSNASGEIELTSLDAGLYHEIAVLLGSCSDTVFNVTLTDPNAPALIMPSDASVCEGASYLLVAGNPDNASITWSNGVADNTSFVPTETETLNATAELNGCESFGSFDLTVLTLPNATMTGGGLICQDETSIATVSIAVVDGASPYMITYADELGSNTTVSVSGSSYDLSTSDANSYSLVSVSDANGCLGTVSGNVEVDTLTRLIVAHSDPVCSTDLSSVEIQLDITGGSSPYVISGTNTSITSSDNFQLISIPSSEGEETVYTLDISDNSGCTGELYSTTISGGIDCAVPPIELPNSMTPNEDGFNDQFWITNIEYYPDNILKIYNRWGDLVFEENGYLNEWEGNRNGKRLPFGTYYYVLNLKSGAEDITGFIMILE